MMKKEIIFKIIRIILVIFLLITIPYANDNILNSIIVLAGFIAIIKFALKGVNDLIDLIFIKYKEID